MHCTSAKTHFSKTSILDRGFALLYALWFSAIASVLGLSMVSSFLTNTMNVGQEAHRIQAELLHDAALRFAVLDLVAPRDSVSSGGVPNQKLIYKNALAPVKIAINNESAFIDMALTPPSILREIFDQLGINQAVIDQLTNHLAGPVIQAGEALETKPSVNLRWLKQTLKHDPNTFNRITASMTFYNGSAQVNQNIVSETLLRALPDLSSSDASALINERTRASKQSVSKAIIHPMLSNRASSHYRITTSLKLGDIISSRTQIIALSNNADQLFKVVAQL